jgi:hypothetical protein
VQLGEELDSISAREQLLYYTAEMIATKAKVKIVKKKKSCQKVGKKVVKMLKRKILKRSEEDEEGEGDL